jgi:hypothetical protein
MFDFSREVFICKCATDVAATDDGALRFRDAGERDLSRLESGESLDDLRARLARGERWLVGEAGGEIVTYTWLITGARFEYTYLPGCAFQLRADTGYGYGAFTVEKWRGRGFRRRAFVAELRLLRALGKTWEAGVFIKPQLDGATRSLARVGIAVVPLWRVVYTRQRTLAAERLCDDDCVTPLFEYAPLS